MNVKARDGGSSGTSCSRLLFHRHTAGGRRRCIIDLAGLSALKMLQGYRDTDVAALQKSFSGSMYTSHFQVPRS